MKMKMLKTLSDGSGTYYADKEYQFEPKRAKELEGAGAAVQVEENAAAPASKAAKAPEKKDDKDKKGKKDKKKD